MEEERTQVVSLRLSEESYGRLKTYADAHGESVSDAVRRAIETLIQADAEPAAPTSVPAQPSSPVESVSEAAGIRGELEEVAGRGEQTMRYVEGMTWRLNELQGTVNNILALLTPHLPPPPPVPFPGFPAPPWVTLSAAGWQGLSETVAGELESALDGKGLGDVAGAGESVPQA